MVLFVYQKKMERKKTANHTPKQRQLPVKEVEGSKLLNLDHEQLVHLGKQTIHKTSNTYLFLQGPHPQASTWGRCSLPIEKQTNQLLWGSPLQEADNEKNCFAH